LCCRKPPNQTYTVLASTNTNGNGGYFLTYTFTSVCLPSDGTADFVSVSANGYDYQSTFGSALVIYCTSDVQLINFSLHHTPIARTTD
jgi:hypothetical protein